MPTTRRPRKFCCTDECPRRRHAAIRRFLAAVREAREAAERLDALPGDDPFAEDVRAMLWACRVVGSMVEGETFACCHPDEEVIARAGRMKKRLAKCC